MQVFLYVIEKNINLILQSKQAIHVATEEKKDKCGSFYPLSAYV
jgi:hypothetical protein